MHVSARLGQRIRELRTARQLTQEALAERAGITWHFVSAIERNTKGATLDTLAAIAAAFDMTLSELFVGVDKPLPRESKRLEMALAGRSLDTQKRILRIIDESLALEK